MKQTGGHEKKQVSLQSIQDKLLSIYASSDTYNDKVNGLFQYLCTKTSASKCLFALYNKDRNMVAGLPPIWGTLPEFLKEFKFSLETKSALKIAIKKHGPYIINDPAHNPYIIKNFVVLFNTKKVAILPLFNEKDEFFGAIYFAGDINFSRSDSAFLKKAQASIYLFIKSALREKNKEEHCSLYSNNLNSVIEILKETDAEKSLKELLDSMIKKPFYKSIKATIIEETGKNDVKIYVVNDSFTCPANSVKTDRLTVTLITNQQVTLECSYCNELETTATLELDRYKIIHLLNDSLSNDIAQRNSFRLHILFRIFEETQNAEDLKSLADLITRTLFQYYFFEDVSFFIRDEERGVMELVSFRSIFNNSVKLPYTQSEDKGIVGKAVKNGEVVVVLDMDKFPEKYTSSAERQSFKSEIAIPLFFDGKVTALINVESTRKFGFSTQDIEYLKIFGRLTEAAMSRILSNNKTKRLIEEFKYLGEIAKEFTADIKPEDALMHMARSLASFINNPYIYTVRMLNGNLLLKRSDGIASKISEKQIPLEFKQSLEKGQISFFNYGGYNSMLIPIHTEQSKNHAILIQKKEGKFTEDDITFFKLVIDYVEKLLTNIYLYANIKKNLTEINMLYQYSKELSDIREKRTLLEHTYSIAKRLFGIEDFYAALYDADENIIIIEIDYDGDIKQRKRISPITDAKGLTAWIIKNRKPVIINDWDRDIVHYPVAQLGNKITQSYVGVPLLTAKKVLGVIAIQSPYRNHFTMHTMELLSTVAYALTIALSNIDRLEKLEEVVHQLESTYMNTLEALSSALDYREHETEHHSKRVALYAKTLAERLGIKGDALQYIYWGGLLHDIGKIGIPDSILLKPGKLTEDEWSVMKRHVIIGYEIIKSINFLEPTLKLLLHHHEWWNGKGYPLGLKGEEIPIEARIFSIVDAFDAMTSDRPYRNAMSYKKSVEELNRMRGIQFDPGIVDIFLKIPVSELKAINPNLIIK